MYLYYTVTLLLINKATCNQMAYAAEATSSQMAYVAEATSSQMAYVAEATSSQMAYVAEAATSISYVNITRTLRGIPQDGLYDFIQMAAKYKHPAKEHFVITEDGYNLTLYNLPGDKRRPVLLCHGVFDSSDGWIIRGSTSLPIMLADQGYDVWLLNQRGNRYSRRHEKLNPDRDSQFWDFSLHELGYYDMPANIDFILSATGQSQLSVVGFSEGTSMGYVLGATKPEYNEKIKVLVSLAPIAYLQNAVGPLRVLILLGPFLDNVIPFFVNEIGGFFTLSKAIINLLCTQLMIGYDFCFGGLVNPLIGPNMASIEPGFFDIIVGHFPAGTSKKNLIHFSQIGIRGTFGNYDYGTARNLERYRSIQPPSYDLKKVTMPVYLVSGKNDRVSTMADVEILHSKLPNVREWKILEDPLYNHLDHLWAIDADRVVYDYVLETLAGYN